MKDLIIILVVVAVVGFGVYSTVKKRKEKASCCSGGTYRAKEKKLEQVNVQKTAVIEGMTCQHCVNRVMEALNSIDGASAKVNLRKGTAVISMEQPMDDDVFRNAIEKAGYAVKEIK